MEQMDGTPVPSTDAKLLERLRKGDLAAYDDLWSRHIGAALRYARRLAPLEPEDLVAEAFTNVFHEIVVAGKGPTKSFGAYLFTAIRHTAMRWQRESHRVVVVAEIEDLAPAVESPPLGEVEDHTALLRAFRGMPERWQRVLWLTGVEGVSRAEAARHLGMKPNAVSALQRRAREGFRERLLQEHVPHALRTDSQHVARLLPAALTEKARLSAAAAAHVEACETCQEVRRQLLSIARRTTRVSLATIGFGALAVTIRSVSEGASTPAAAAVVSLSGGSAATAVLSTGASAGGATAALVKAAAAVAGIFLLVDVTLPGTGSVEAPTAQAAVTTPTPSIHSPAPGSATPAAEPPAPTASATVPPKEPAGGSDDADHAFVDFWRTGSPGGMPAPAPTPPASAPPGSVPQPGADSDPDALPTPTVTSVDSTQGYVAPELRGSAEPRAQIAVQVDDTVYGVSADATGAWSFDVSALPLAYGDHVVRSWQYSATAVSPAAVTHFTVQAPVLDGFLILGALDATVARDTGLVFTVAGPAGGVACLGADTGQSVQIPLDASGQAARRVRFLNSGPYVLNVAICDAARQGPATTSPIDIQDSGFGVFGDLVEREIVVSDP